MKIHPGGLPYGKACYYGIPTNQMVISTIADDNMLKLGQRYLCIVAIKNPEQHRQATLCRMTLIHIWIPMSKPPKPGLDPF